jgi:SAM-dependent methyltransferase
MNRADILQQIIHTIKAKSYLEIGVSRGDVFFPMLAKRKVAVDPAFRFYRREQLKSIFKNFCNLHNRYFEITSDEFFQTKADKLFHTGLDIAFVDGLHTYQQSLKDVDNCLKWLKKDGVIVIHDCNPHSQAMAYPAENIKQAKDLNLPGWSSEWCGDVWKAVVHLRSFYQNLRVFVLDTDYGVGIVTRGRPENMLHMTQESIQHLSYQDLVENRRDFLNLKKVETLPKFLETLRSV